MRKLVYTNPNNVSFTFDDSLFGITKLTGLGEPDLNIQEQKAPFQDGSTNIDQLLNPREVVCEGVIAVGHDLLKRYQYRRQMSAAVNAKLGPGTLRYYNDYGTWDLFNVLPEGPIFGNKNANEGNQDFQITFYCHDPYLYDIEDTTVDLAGSNSGAIIENLGDVPTPVKITIQKSGKNVAIYNNTQDKKIGLTGNQYGISDIVINTAFGEKTVTASSNQVNTSAMSLDFKSIAFSEKLGMYCAAMESMFLVSYDGISWTSIRPGTNGVYSVAYSEKQALWVVLGTDITHSIDGLTWLSSSSGAISALLSVVFNTALNLWCAVGASGVILTSPDGSVWTSRTSGTTATLRYISCLSSLFIAVGDSGTILTSPDGITWTSRTSGTTASLQGIACSASLAVAVGGIGKIYTSPDGITWTSRTSGISSDNLRSIAYSAFQNIFMGTGDTEIFSSSDGVTWSIQLSGISSTLYTICYSTLLDKWLAGGNNVHWYSKIGSGSWTALNRYAAVGGAGGGFIAHSSTLNQWLSRESVSSDNGSTWTYNLPDGSFSSACWSTLLNLWCVVGDSGKICTSPDGITWTSRTSGTSNLLRAVAFSYVCNLFIAVGDSGTILTSPDGITWTSRTSGTTASLQGIFCQTYGGNKIIIVGGATLYSINGIDWINENQVIGNSIFYSDILALWVIVGPGSNGGAIYTSPDGLIWTLRFSPSEVLHSVLYSSTRKLFYAGGANGCIYTSPDGINWTLLKYVACDYITLGYDDDNDVLGIAATQMVSIGDIDSKVVNAINLLTLDSSFWDLSIGKNLISLKCDYGYATGVVSFRNRYTGV